MNKNTQLSLLTFLGVGLIILIFGMIGLNISLKYIGKHFIQLQIDVNKRQAERMAYIIKKEIRSGIPLDTIKNDFQASIVGTEYDKGFLCMYDFYKKQLVCHPDPKSVGQPFTKDFIFKSIDSDKETYIGNIYKLNKPAGGIFVQSTLRTDIIYTIPIEGTNWYINAHENINAISTELRQIKIRYILGSFILGIIIAFAASITARRISRNYEKQIEQKNTEITIQRDKIAEKNKEITDSINYAEKIQTAVLPNRQIFNEFFPENFLLYLPKDIVSGDFYWFTNTEDSFIITVADCTGHGVPGALISILGITLINEIIKHKKIESTDQILNELRNGIKSTLNQEKSDSESRDGMDVSLCVIDKSKKVLHYSGAYNPIYIVRNDKNNNSFELLEYKADRMPVGKYPKDEKLFSFQEIGLQKNDTIYMFSDGYVSQFGGNDGSTFKSKNFKELLLSIQQKPLQIQKEIIFDTFQKWKGRYPQIDDILVIGYKV